MRFVSKLGSVLLMATLTANCWAVRGFIPLAQLAEHPVSCHERGNSSPRHAPVHNCCLMGHDAAVAQPTTAERPPAECHQRIAFASGHLPALATLGFAQPSPTSSPESPGIAPLRV